MKEAQAVAQAKPPPVQHSKSEKELIELHRRKKAQTATDKAGTSGSQPASSSSASKRAASNAVADSEDVSSLKVAELRERLAALGADTKGLKKVLVDRLQDLRAAPSGGMAAASSASGGSAPGASGGPAGKRRKA